MQIRPIVDCPTSRAQYIYDCKQAIREFLPLCKRISHQYFYQREKYIEATHEHRKLGPKIGVVVGYFDQNDKLFMGASRCNRKAGDEFDRHIGLYQAIRRAKPVIGLELPEMFAGVPESLHRTFAHVFDRLHEFAAS